MFRHIVYGNFHFLAFDPTAVLNEILYRSEWPLSKLVTLTIEDLKLGRTLTVSSVGGSHEELVTFCSRVIEAEELDA